jgi:hypothetical protein
MLTVCQTLMVPERPPGLLAQYIRLLQPYRGHLPDPLACNSQQAKTLPYECRFGVMLCISGLSLYWVITQFLPTHL